MNYVRTYFQVLGVLFTFATIGNPTVYASTSTDGLVSYWKLDETSAGSFTDSSGHSKTGTGNGASGANNTPQPTDTKATLSFTNAKALDFDGTDDYVNVTSSSEYSFGTGDFAISVWVKTSDGSDDGILTKIDGSNNGFSLGTSSGKARFFTIQGATIQSADSTTSINGGTWHHLVAQRSSGTGYVYVNGTSENTFTSSANITTSSALKLGDIRYNGGGQKWTGQIDDVRVYNRALSTTEITALAAGTHTAATWDGSSSTNWETAANWDINAVPDNYTTITIADTSNDPILNANVDVASLTINSSAVLDLNGYNFGLKDSGTFTNNGTLVLDGDETLTSFTNDTDTGTVRYEPTDTDVTGLNLGNTYNNLTFDLNESNPVVGYWKFDAGTGTSAVDSSGNSLTGTLTSGPTWSATVPADITFTNPYSLTFDGTDDYINIGDNSLLEPTAISISTWLRITGDGGNGQTNGSYAITKGRQGTEPYNSYGIRYIPSGDTIACDIGVSGTQTTATSTSTFTPTSDWIHVVCTYDGSNIRLWIDGANEATTAASGSISYTMSTNDDLHIGNWGLSGFVRSFAGDIDDVRIYDWVLGSNQISQLASNDGSTNLAFTYTLGANVDVNADFALSGGTLDVSATNYDITVGGNFTNSGTFTSQAGTVTFDATDTGNTFNPGSSSFYDVTFNGSGGVWDLTSNALDVNNALTITNGIFDLNSQNLTNTGGSFSNSGTLRLQGSETITGFTNDTDSGDVMYDGTGTYASGLAAGDNYYNLTFSSTGAYTVDAALDINNNLTIQSGILSGSNQTIDLAGNWNNYAGSSAFTAGTSTVDLDGSSTQTVRGSNTFYNLEASTSSAQTISFESGATQSIASGGSLTLTGASSNLLTLAPVTATTDWLLDVAANATKTLSYLSVSYSDASAGSSLNAGETSTNGGNNDNWFFDSSNPTLDTISPTDNATGVSPTANLVLTFSEVVDTESGNVTIKKTSDDTIVETIDVTSGQVTGSGTTTITVNPTTTLSDVTGYYVQIAATAFDDSAGNSYTGIGDTTTWNFTTGDSTAPAISTVASTATQTGSTITWTTDEDASSQVEYGLTGSYGTTTTETDTSPRVTSHSVTISGLVCGTTYYFRVTSVDASSNSGSSSDATFITAACDVPSGEQPSDPAKAFMGFADNLSVPTVSIAGQSTTATSIQSLTQDTPTITAVKPSDPGQLVSLTLQIGNATYTLTDPDGDFTYTTMIIRDTPGYATYKLTADYGTIQLVSRGIFLVLPPEKSPSAAVSPTIPTIVITAPTSTVSTAFLPSFAPSISFEEEITIEPLPSQEPGVSPEPQPTTLPPLTPPEATVFDDVSLRISSALRTIGDSLTTLGEGIAGGTRVSLRVADSLLRAAGELLVAGGRTVLAALNAGGAFVITLTTDTIAAIFEEGLNISSALAAAFSEAQKAAGERFTRAWEDITADASRLAQNAKSGISAARQTPAPTSDPRIPEELRNHRYEEVTVRIATAEGAPLAGAQLTLFSEPKEAVTNEHGMASFTDVPIGEHHLKISFGKFQGEQTLFFADSVPELLVNVTPSLNEGIHPLWLLAALVSGAGAMWFVAKRRFTGHFVI